MIRVTPSLDETRAIITGENGQPPAIVATCARRYPNATRFVALAERLRAGKPHLVLFGTAWGLSPELIEASDVILEPIGDHQGYNHLSVRCAAAIALDRLMTSRP